MKRKKLAILLTTILMIVAVAGGVHLMHKDALALSTYTIHVSQNGGGAASGVYVKFEFPDIGQVNGQTNANGDATLIENEATQFTAYMVDSRYTADLQCPDMKYRPDPGTLSFTLDP